jgi:hypothetical protein
METPQGQIRLVDGMGIMGCCLAISRPMLLMLYKSMSYEKWLYAYVFWL